MLTVVDVLAAPYARVARFPLYAVQVLGLLFMQTTPIAMDTFMARAAASDNAGGVQELREGMA